MTARLTREQVDALLADKERALQRAQRKRRESPDDLGLSSAADAAKAERRLVLSHSQCMAKDWQLTCPAEHHEAMRAPTRDAFVRVTDAVALVMRFYVDVAIAGAASVTLTVQAAKRAVPSALPGIYRAEQMRYTTWRERAEAPTPQGALELALARVLTLA
jgi:hypothetical protein